VAWSLGDQPRSPDEDRGLIEDQHFIMNARYAHRRIRRRGIVWQFCPELGKWHLPLLAVLATRPGVHSPPLSLKDFGLNQHLHIGHLQLLMTNCSSFRSLRLCNPRPIECCDRKLEHVCLACIRPFLVGDTMVSLNPFRSRSKSTRRTIRSLPNRCTCKRCNCPHAEELHSLRKYPTGTHYQVFCAACNDVCLAHSMKGPPGVAEI